MSGEIAKQRTAGSPGTSSAFVAVGKTDGAARRVNELIKRCQSGNASFWVINSPFYHLGLCLGARLTGIDIIFKELAACLLVWNNAAPMRSKVSKTSAKALVLLVLLC